MASPQQQKTPSSGKIEVLALGLARTGTTSLEATLQQLGYGVYHGWKLIRNNDTVEAFCKAYDEKFHGKEGKAWDREEWDKLFGDDQVAMGMPAYFFLEELMDAYPDAKIIITSRGVESWVKSLNATFFRKPTLISVIAPYLSQTSAGHAALARRCREYFCNGRGDTPADFAAHGPDRFHNHYARLRAKLDQEEHKRTSSPSDVSSSFLKPTKRQVLEYKVQQGWEPLCAFLGKEVPEGKFPHVNTPEEFNARIGKIFEANVWWFVKWRLPMILLAFAVGGGVMVLGGAGQGKMMGGWMASVWARTITIVGGGKV